MIVISDMYLLYSKDDHGKPISGPKMWVKFEAYIAPTRWRRWFVEICGVYHTWNPEMPNHRVIPTHYYQYDFKAWTLAGAIQKSYRQWEKIQDDLINKGVDSWPWPEYGGGEEE